MGRLSRPALLGVRLLGPVGGTIAGAFTLPAHREFHGLLAHIDIHRALARHSVAIRGKRPLTACRADRAGAFDRPGCRVTGHLDIINRATGSLIDLEHFRVQFAFLDTARVRPDLRLRQHGHLHDGGHRPHARLDRNTITGRQRSPRAAEQAENETTDQAQTPGQQRVQIRNEKRGARHRLNGETVDSAHASSPGSTFQMTNRQSSEFVEL